MDSRKNQKPLQFAGFTEDRVRIEGILSSLLAVHQITKGAYYYESPELPLRNRVD
jgi:hypothetical protein